MNTLKVSNFFSLFSTSQKFMITFVVCVVSALVFADEGGSNTAPDKTQKKLVMEESEWKKKLSPEQYRILRQAGTERPFGDVYKKFKDQGLGKYVCAGCDTELFSSNEKFDSKCGWPSFYDPSKAKNVKTSVDYLLGYPRMRFCVQYVMVTLDMFSLEKDLILLQTKDIALMEQFKIYSG